MTKRLPDVALNEISAHRMPLQWVGMDNIALPLLLKEDGLVAQVSASADVAVNLPNGDVKGIHMSRLYGLLDDYVSIDPLAPSSVDSLLASMINSHRDCGTTAARLTLHSSVLRRKKALVTEKIGGWRSYPFQLTASKNADEFRAALTVTILYSSTCPCSAALARQHVRDAFMAEFAGVDILSITEMSNWLLTNATAATPHSQRSEAKVTVQLPYGLKNIALFKLIDRIEESISTPVQTAVKRADEQAFAKLNGKNLMYVEDAVRLISASLLPDYSDVRVSVRHLESLHAHDAVAVVEPLIFGAGNA